MLFHPLLAALGLQTAACMEIYTLWSRFDIVINNKKSGIGVFASGIVCAKYLVWDVELLDFGHVVSEPLNSITKHP
jgi:hypothetical protein